MKKLFILLTLLVSCVAAQAQWSVGLDARIAPWGNDQKNMGTDIVANYKLPVGGFFIMTSVGFFYQKYTQNRNVEYYYVDKRVQGQSSRDDIKYDFGYRSGIDLTCVIGKSFSLGTGDFAIFTGPRYAYAYAEKPDESAFCNHLQNSFDLRVGASYTLWKITASAKCDIGLLRYLKQDNAGDYNDRQVPILAIGVAYNF